ncbi:MULTISPECIES: SurA N-terminal domain-containing protein [Candidatus Ichthyocystis]|nr:MULTISPECIES: SurA N-terminal domain-containing protein [Ichthyocystis]
MFGFVSRNRRLVTVSLAFVAISFSFWGVSSYFSVSGGRGGVAHLADHDLYAEDFNNIYHQRQIQVRQEMGSSYSSDLFDTPEIRGSFFLRWAQSLSFQRWVFDQRIGVSDYFLVDAISKLSIFLDSDGKFSRTMYEKFLKNRGTTASNFEQRLRSDMAVSNVRDVLSQAILSNKIQDSLSMRQKEELKVVYKSVPVDRALVKKLPTEAQISEYYNDYSHRNFFYVPARFDIEYIVWGPESVSVNVSDKEEREYYNSHKPLFVHPDRYRVFNILIALPDNVSDVDRDRIRNRAVYVSSRVGTHPSLATFRKMAKLFSDDKISSEKGGDLGFVGDGILPYSLEQAVKKVKVGERVPGIVESKYGFHVLFLSDVQRAQVDSFNSVLPEIRKELRLQKARTFLHDNLSAFSDMVESQVDDLKPVAERWKLSVFRTGLTTKEELKSNKILHSERLLSDLLSSDGLEHHRNSEVIPLSVDHWVVARVSKHVPGHVRSLSESREIIFQNLMQETAENRSRAESLKLFEKLKTDKSGKSVSSAGGWSPVVSVFASHKASEYGFTDDFYTKLINAKKGDILEPVKFSDSYRIYRVVGRVFHTPTEQEKLKYNQLAKLDQGGVELFMFYDYLLDHYHFRVTKPRFWVKSDNQN